MPEMDSTDKNKLPYVVKKFSEIDFFFEKIKSENYIFETVDLTRLDPQARVAPEGREAARRFIQFHIFLFHSRKYPLISSAPNHIKPPKPSL